jgi:hypothetical protein
VTFLHKTTRDIYGRYLPVTFLHESGRDIYRKFMFENIRTMAHFLPFNICRWRKGAVRFPSARLAPLLDPRSLDPLEPFEAPEDPPISNTEVRIRKHSVSAPHPTALAPPPDCKLRLSRYLNFLSLKLV